MITTRNSEDYPVKALLRSPTVLLLGIGNRKPFLSWTLSSKHISDTQYNDRLLMLATKMTLKSKVTLV